MATVTNLTSELADLWATQIDADIRRTSGIGVIQGEQSCTSATVSYTNFGEGVNTTGTAGEIQMRRGYQSPASSGYDWYQTVENGRPILMEE